MVAVELRVATARDVNPEVKVIGGFEDELVVVGVVHIAVDQCTAITRTDGYGLVHIVAKRLEDVLAEVAQILDY